LKDVYGRPQIPLGFLGSISHKSCTGVALVTLSNTSVSIQNHPLTDILTENVDSSVRKSVGVDIERTFSRRSSIAKKVLTPNEMKQLGKLENVTKDEEVLLRFRYSCCLFTICSFLQK
jgi:4'-phosphopantetheinyl transferase EntD